MPLFIGDYLADTSRLTTEQHGAYLLLLMDYWRNGPPPDDNGTLAQITRLSFDAWSNARAKLEQFFTIENGVWRQKRVDEEMASAAVNKGKASAKAKAAADARWGKDEKNAPSNAPSKTQAMLEECPLPSPSPSQTTTSKPSVKKPDEYPKEFEAAWEAYPPRSGASKPDSLKGWKARIKAGASAEEILSGVKRYATYVEARGTEDSYIKQPVTFFGPGNHFKSNWAISQPRGSPPRPEKFDPTAHVNRNKVRSTNERTIDIDERGEPI